MKKQIQRIIIGCLLGMSISANAQFNQFGPPLFTYGRTNAAVQKIGIGNFPNNASVQAKFHVNEFLLAANAATNGRLLRTDGNSAQVNQWQMFTGTAANNAVQRGRIFNPAFSNNFNMESTLGRIEFHAAGGQSATTNLLMQRMIITNGDYRNAANAIVAANVTRVGISYGDGQGAITAPRTLLHLGFNANPGFRNWMDVGMYLTRGDNMYIGLKDEANNRQDAVINWGDDGVPAAGPDNLRFIFTDFNGGALGGGFNGLEGMRMTPTANGMFTGIGGDPTFPNNYVGGGINPTNTLEVNSWGATNVPGGSSGLRFTNLNTTSPTIANPGIGVLSVNANGDVIYVPGGAGAGITAAQNGTSLINPTTVELGQVYNTAGNPGRLLHNTEIPMNNFDLSFVGQATGTNRIGIGIQTPFAKVDIRNNTESITGQFITNANLPGDVYGIYSQTTGSASQNYGVNGEGVGPAINNYGIRGASVGATFTNYGGFFAALNPAPRNFGVFSFAQGAATTNYGIWAQASGATNNFAGWFQGDVNVNGALTVFGVPVLTSDVMFKKNIDTVANALTIIKQLKPKTFNFDTANTYGISFSGEKQYGLVAQDVETVLPELVISSFKPEELDSVGNVTKPSVLYKSLNYNAFIAILMKGMQEQQLKIDNLNTTVAQLASIIDTCCSNNAASKTSNNTNGSLQNTTTTDITLTNAQTIVLEQNVPNPFAEQTTINYFLPDNTGKAQILFYNAAGKLIQSIDLSQKGKGQINVFASDLSNGIYTYALIVDGKIVETKKMLKQ